MDNEERKLFQIKNTSSYLALIAVVLSIEADQIANTRVNIKEAQDASDDLTVLALYLIAISALIDLGTAKYEFDEIMNNIENEKPLDVAAAKNLLISRVLSIAAVFYLFRATFQSIEAKGQDDLTPDPAGAAVI